MTVTKKQFLLDKFKESYILKKANQMANDYEFIKGFTLNKVTEYMHLLFAFLKENKTQLDNFFNSLKNDKKIDKDNLFLTNLTFIFNIPKLINTHNNETEIDYVFLQKNFLKIKTKQKSVELTNSLNQLEQKFKAINSNSINFKDDSSFNLSDLYKFGEFILNFLTEFEIRKIIAKDLLISKLETNNNKFDKEFKLQFIQKQKNTNIWNSTQRISL